MSKELTEQWNRGRLPEGDYYIKRRNGDLPYDNIDSRGVWRNSIDEDIIEVIAPVPSYDEWQAKDNAITYLLAECGKLTKELQDEKEKNMIRFSLRSPEDENEKLRGELKEICEKYLKIKTTVSAYEDAYKDSQAYIKQLKDLLKRTRKHLSEQETPYSLIKRIDRVLNHEKASQSL